MVTPWLATELRDLYNGGLNIIFNIKGSGLLIYLVNTTFFKNTYPFINNITGEWRHIVDLNTLLQSLFKKEYNDVDRSTIGWIFKKLLSSSVRVVQFCAVLNGESCHSLARRIKKHEGEDFHIRDLGIRGVYWHVDSTTKTPFLMLRGSDDPANISYPRKMSRCNQKFF